MTARPAGSTDWSWHMTTLLTDDRVVFYGDSITAAGRVSGRDADLGDGYVQVVAAVAGAAESSAGLVVYNRGVSGDRTADLVERFDRDVRSLAPTVLSILVGINDTWRRYDSGDVTSSQEYEARYRQILDWASGMPGLRLVLIEPFLLPLGPEQAAWREDLDPKIAVVRVLAAEYGACLIEADRLFTEVALQAGPRVWVDDGVHLTTAGHEMLGRAWLTG